MGTCGYIRILGRVIWNVESGVHGNRIMNITSSSLMAGTSRNGMLTLCTMWFRVSMHTSLLVNVYEYRLKCTSAG